MPHYNMTRQLISILTILLVACGQSSQSDENPSIQNKKEIVNDSLQTFSVTKTTVDDFNKAKNSFKDNTLYDTQAFKKINGEIKLPVDEKWQPFAIFKDTLLNTDDSGIRQYEYVGQFDKIGFYIVNGSFWEHNEYYLIDKRTGRQTTTWSTPIISPNEKYIANLSMAYGLEGVPNGIQIWRIDRHKENEVEPITIVKHLELDQQIWAPDDFAWETDNSIILKVASVENYLNENGHPNQNDFYYLRLTVN
jgi:hypothetical protein